MVPNSSAKAENLRKKPSTKRKRFPEWLGGTSQENMERNRRGPKQKKKNADKRSEGPHLSPKGLGGV